MFTLQKVFSDGALFQADSVLKIKGTTLRNENVCVRIIRNGQMTAEASAHSDNSGVFEAEVRTPSASFDKAEIILSCAGDEYIMKDVLFGEVWLASGQSNMELPNSTHPEFDALWETMKDKNIRVFHVDYPSYGAEGAFPWEPEPMMSGRWIMPGDREGMRGVSACAFRFVIDVYDALNKSADVPVAFLNCSWGGTPISAYFPYSEVVKDERIIEDLKRGHNYPTPENWNTRGGGNFQQTCAQYNVKIAPVEGLKMRGVIWYQGENDAYGEFSLRVYADYLRFYQKIYAERFGADPESFMMISSLIYPWTYGGSGECCLGYLNNAFIETAVEAPDKFAFMPITDLEPVWGYHVWNHPIHPTNKYDVGARMADLALRNTYGMAGQKAPATLESYKAEGNRITLKFRDVGSGLRVNEKVLHGMYVAGDDGIYLPAEYEIQSENTMYVWSDEIEKPVNAAYGILSLEPKINLFAGDYPVASFYTDDKNFINIEARPWYDTARDAFWGSKMHDDVLDLFFRPTFTAGCETEIVRDTAFRYKSEASLRVEPEDTTASVIVKSYPYNRLDLEKFSALKVNLFNMANVAAKLVLESDNGRTEAAFEKKKELIGSWAEWQAEIKVPEGEIKKMTFEFTFASDRYNFVNMENIRLVK